MVTEDQLKQIMPNLPQDKRALYQPFLDKAMTEFEINTPLRVAAFLAQIAHESAEFKFMREIWGPTAAQKRYEPTTTLSKNLGNTQPGDGKRYMGRGPIQITGRANYQRYGSALGIDIVNNPDTAANPDVAFRVAGLYWKKNGLNELADQQMFKTITKRINGGFNGLEDRQKYYARAKSVLGIGATRGFDSGPEDTGDDSGLPTFGRGAEFMNEETMDVVGESE